MKIRKTKQSTLLEMSMSDFAQIKGQMCAWDGCGATCEVKGLDLPRGWRWLALWWGREPMPFGNGNYVDRDCVLCPKHFAELHDHLLKDIGQRLNQTKGTA